MPEINTAPPAPAINSVPVKSVDTEPMTLASLMAKRPPFKDVPIAGLGTFRMHRLYGVERLRLRMELGSLSDENGEADEEKILDMMSRVACKCLRGDFDSDEGYETIRGLATDELISLIRHVSGVNSLGIGANDEVADTALEEIEEAKNE